MGRTKRTNATREFVTMTTRVLGSFVIAALLLGCVPAETPTDGRTTTSLPNCGKIESNPFASYKESPTTDEGAGFVGIATEENNATGRTYQRYSLVNCATRDLVKVEGEWQLGEVTPNGPEGINVAQLVDSLRNNGRLTVIGRLGADAKDRGFLVTSGRLPQTGTERSDCACGQFYPETLPEDRRPGIIVY